MTIVAAAFALNPQLDPDRLARDFARDGRVQVPGFLEDRAARALHAMLHERMDWVQVLNVRDKVYDIPRETRAAMSQAERDFVDTEVYAQARDGFQYRYEAIRVPDDSAERASSPDPLAAFAQWMSGGSARDALRRITGNTAIAFADAQATAYGPGDFLTMHDDGVAGKRRHAAYVLGLSPVWRTEWGGLLLFHGPRLEGYAPAFNTLNLFRVPQLHSVSEVTRAAGATRYAITGWLREAG